TIHLHPTDTAAAVAKRALDVVPEPHGRSPAVPEELHGLHRVKPGSLQVDAPRLRCESELLGAHTVTARQRQNLPELTLLFGHLVNPAPEHSSRNSSIWVASGKRRQSFVVPGEPCQHAGFDLG